MVLGIAIATEAGLAGGIRAIGTAASTIDGIESYIGVEGDGIVAVTPWITDSSGDEVPPAGVCGVETVDCGDGAFDCSMAYNCSIFINLEKSPVPSLARRELKNDSESDGYRL